MASVVQGVIEVRDLIGVTPVIVGGLAVLSRLSTPYRATVDLDVVDRLHGSPQLEILRAASGAEAVEPAAVILPTRYGPVRVDVLEVRKIELDAPSDDPGDRLHAFAHAWASDTATEMVIEVLRRDGDRIEVSTRVAEPGPLIAMKLQSVMNRSEDKQGTDLLDIVRLMLDAETRPVALAQISAADAGMARDIAIHVDLWFVRRRGQTLQRVRATGGTDQAVDDLDLVAELLMAASDRATS
jgi:hypothetical protein